VTVRACRPCLLRTWMLEALAGHLEPVRGRAAELLLLDDGALIDAVAGRDAGEIQRLRRVFAFREARERILGAGLEAVCRCDERYPAALRDLPAPPAVVHVAGTWRRLEQLLAESPVSIVGARQATGYGRDAARTLAAGCASAGLTVVSGMALGVDGAAHAGALEVGGPTIAVLPSGADRPYPAGHRALYRRIVAGGGVAISELPPGLAPRRWMFPARNRLIAALSAMTVVVQGRRRSGSLVTASWAQALGRSAGAVPGSIATELSAGPHALLRDGGRLVTGVQDVLDAIYGVGERQATTVAPGPADPQLSRLLDELAGGETPAVAVRNAGYGAEAGLSALAALELGGLIRRAAGGRYTVRR
jgi:DNA processing protein